MVSAASLCRLSLSLSLSLLEEDEEEEDIPEGGGLRGEEAQIDSGMEMEMEERRAAVVGYGVPRYAL